MKLFKVIKRKIENFRTKPDENFEFEQDYFGKVDVLEGFNFLYCNNYTDKLYNSNKAQLSFISCVITLPKQPKTMIDLIIFFNMYLNNESICMTNLYRYKNIYVDINHNSKHSQIKIYLRGDLSFYKELCNTIHNNIITKYIRNNIFPNELSIDTPNEFLDNIYNSITNPCKEVDILFIEENTCSQFSPVVGLSIKTNKDYIDLKNKFVIELNNRYITYCEIDKFSEEDLEYLATNVKHGNKILNILHNNITNNDFSEDMDEIIED